jgi:hypothetical protein
MNNKFNTREKILATSSKLFQFQGYPATGLTEILKESGAPILKNCLFKIRLRERLKDLRNFK